MSPPGYGCPTIRQGSQGPNVAYCQNLLNARQHYSILLWVDGIFGPQTGTAVRLFQSTHNLQADGVVGPATWGALEAGPPQIHSRPGKADIPVPATGGV